LLLFVHVTVAGGSFDWIFVHSRFMVCGTQQADLQSAQLDLRAGLDRALYPHWHCRCPGWLNHRDSSLAEALVAQMVLNFAWPLAFFLRQRP
jgi:hypothetical protein